VNSPSSRKFNWWNPAVKANIVSTAALPRLSLSRLTSSVIVTIPSIDISNPNNKFARRPSGRVERNSRIKIARFRARNGCNYQADVCPGMNSRLKVRRLDFPVPGRWGGEGRRRRAGRAPGRCEDLIKTFKGSGRRAISLDQARSNCARGNHGILRDGDSADRRPPRSPGRKR